MATQQARPATNSSAISALGEMPSARSRAGARRRRDAMPCDGARRRSSKISGSMVTTQNTPMPIWVARQPCVAMKYWSSGGQIVPAR